LVTLRCQNREFKNIEAIIFDKDGTLEDSQAHLRILALKRARLIDAQIPGIGETLLMAFGIDGERLDPAGLMAVGSRRENEVAAAAYIAETGRSWFESVAIAQDAFLRSDQMLQNPLEGAIASPMFDQTPKVLEYLCQSGLKLGILSASPTQSIQNFIDHHQLADYLDVILGSDGDLTKPDPRFYREICQKLGVDPQATLMVGDSQGDIAMAQQAGAAGAIAINWYGKNLTSLAKADVIITQLNDLQLS
jgi:phosphoglycolate phosphatase